jgi:hypothetical protein
MRRKKALLALVIAGIALLTALIRGGQGMASGVASAETGLDIPAEALRKLGRAKIYFGHQSVGFNILEGLDLIRRENEQFKLKIVRITMPGELTSPMLAHSPVGENSDSHSKIAAFAEFMDKGMGSRADIAFFKLCYVDIHRGTDAESIFAEYRTTMASLKKKYPRVRFIHATVPLTVRDTTWKGAFKSLMGKEDNNIQRHRYNELLRREYEGREPVFDIAAAESTRPDGTRSAFEHGGMIYYSLVPSYTYDGGHLNESGKKAVAEELVKVLTEVMGERR